MACNSATVWLALATV
ncbi:hypothetical protein [Siphonobacter sp. BAB-5385]